MTKQEIYTYLGDNGTLSTAVYLPGVNCITKYLLIADEGKVLTNGKIINKSYIVNERELPNWYEIEDTTGQNW